MKKIIHFLFALILVSSLVFAQGNSAGDRGNSDKSSEGTGTLVISIPRYGVPLALRAECKNVGTDSEGWYDQNDELIVLDQCGEEGLTRRIRCEDIGTDSEGWYDTETEELVKYDNCGGDISDPGQFVGKRIRTKLKVQVKAKSTMELKQMIQERRQELNKQIQALKKGRQEIHQNQNRIRLAVHSLLAMENLTEGIGPQISQIAREFNNSVKATIEAEEKINLRKGVLRFFIGGNKKAAGTMEQLVERNQQRIQQLEQLMEDCDCDEEVRAIMQEQIQSMKEEQIRLQQLAETEMKSKGIFGWIWK